MPIYTLQPTDITGLDCHLRSNFADTNYYTSTTIIVGYEGSSLTRRGIIKFDLTSGSTAPPTNAVVSSATLYITQTAENASDNSTLYIYRIKRAVNVTQATWNSYSTGNAWASAGAFSATDCETTDIGSLSLSATEPNGEKQISLSPSAIQEWISGAFTNNGMLLKMSESPLVDQHIYASHNDATATNRPKIVINWDYPTQISNVLTPMWFT